MGTIYGYCRISTVNQSIERQERNIKAAYPTAIIIKEVFTGTKFQGREKLEKVLTQVKEGDVIVFDSVSRMSRNAAEGVELYKELFNKGVELVFLKEPQVNTTVYKSAIDKNQIELTGDDIDLVLAGINKYLLRLAEKQIEIAFEQAQKEVDDLHQRTVEGMVTAKLNGKQIGQVKGSTLNVKKKEPAKELIKAYNKSFGGTLSDTDTITILKDKLGKFDRKTFYKYKKELLETIQH